MRSSPFDERLRARIRFTRRYIEIPVPTFEIAIGSGRLQLLCWWQWQWGRSVYPKHWPEVPTMAHPIIRILDAGPFSLRYFPVPEDPTDGT